MRLWLVRLINPHPAGPAPIPELPLRISLVLIPALVVSLRWQGLAPVSILQLISVSAGILLAGAGVCADFQNCVHEI